jgi:superfamily II DNA or RNA helicase
LVVLATGLGKTWLSAFDSLSPEYGRVLFVAHREEILSQALATFRRIRPTAKLGYYNGREKAPEADVLFASIQTLNKQNHLRRFARDHFDYIVVDEFHHADTRTYRALIEYFDPKFLLGLTATPERTDGGDLLALCGENLVYRCDMVAGITRGLLSPFAYYGVPDVVDFTNIPWRSGRFDEEELTIALATRTRAQNALEQYRKRAGSRTIGFCVSKVHADFMAKFFLAAGLRAVAVHSGENSAPRAHSLERLEEGELDILFAVDMFNEGVDLPQLDTIMMLRPTESKILWLQQFGRGLRWVENKCLKVIDYIGNHRSFLVKPRTLLQLPAGDVALAKAFDLLQTGDYTLPPGCSVTYELEAVNIMRALLQSPAANQRLEIYYQGFREENGYRPTATEAFHDGYDPKSARSSHGSWLNFVKEMGDLLPSQDLALHALGPFLLALEGTPMTKSFKMVVLLAMLAEGAFSGGITITELQIRVQELARRYAIVRAEFGAALDSPTMLQDSLERNPIQAWVDGLGTDGISYFKYEDEVFSTTFNLPGELQESACELVRELVDWRMAVHSRRVRSQSEAERIVCKVIQSNGNPILFLPPRERMAGIPQGEVDVVADGETYQANFVKIAVNVLHQADDHSNHLPGLLRKWFGPDAGQPGTAFMVAFTRKGDIYQLAPAHFEKEEGLNLWEAYPRAKVPPLFGFEFQGFEAQTGVVERDGLMLLFVTLDKKEKPEAHRYNDGFESPSVFRWQSQNRTTMASPAGYRIEAHQKLGISVHLFVRAKAKIHSITEPFLYCGPITFQRWEGEKPISVWWDLDEPIPQRLYARLGLADQPAPLIL